MGVFDIMANDNFFSSFMLVFYVNKLGTLIEARLTVHIFKNATYTTSYSWCESTVRNQCSSKHQEWKPMTLDSPKDPSNYQEILSLLPLNLTFPHLAGAHFCCEYGRFHFVSVCWCCWKCCNTAAFTSYRKTQREGRNDACRYSLEYFKQKITNVNHKQTVADNDFLKQS